MSRNTEIKPGYTRVSEVSSAFAAYGRIPQETLDKAAARGDHVHELIFDYLNDVPISEDRWMFAEKSVKGYFESFLKFWESFKGLEVVAQEQRFYEDNLMITGQPDVVVTLAGERIIFDWKCTTSIGRHWDIQAQGYFKLFNDGYDETDRRYALPADEAVFIRLDKDGKEPDLKEYRNQNEFKKYLDIYDKYFKSLKCNLEGE